MEIPLPVDTLPRAESGAALSHLGQDKCEWLLSGLFQEPAGWHRDLVQQFLSSPCFFTTPPPSTLLLPPHPPSPVPTVVTTNKGSGVSNHPEPWLNFNLWNTRVWAGIYSIWAVNYIPLIYSSQNDNCSPWHNPTMSNPLLQISVIVLAKWDEEKRPFPNKQNKKRLQGVGTFQTAWRDCTNWLLLLACVDVDVLIAPIKWA